MCGLSALFDAQGADLSRSIREMTDSVRHRGPDGEGYVLFAHGKAPQAVEGHDLPSGRWQAALGHRRLAIIDLSAAGHQPMRSADGGLWIIYNGEVYNYVELRSELQRAGVRFETRTDTEVILAAYRKWGEDCLSHFNGMFAFLIVDWTRQRLFAARDRFGVKPLYYWISPSGQVAFASEIKQFTVLPGWRARLNGQRAYDLLHWGLLDHTAETLFEGVRQIRGGECLSVPLGELHGGIRPRTWYRFAPQASDGSSAADYRDLLEDSVRLRLRADVPVGSCLSGGLDSASIVCLVNRQLRAAGSTSGQWTFSARSSDPRIDEGRFIDAVVRHTGVANLQVQPQPAALFDRLPDLTWHQDEPFGSTSIYAQSEVFALAARNGVKVILDGQGADEQLAGYASFLAARFASLARHLSLAALIREVQAARRHRALPLARIAAYAANELLPETARQVLRRVAGRPATLAAPCLDLERLCAHPSDPFLSCGAKARSVNELSQSQLLYTSLPMLLHWEDRDSMAHSIEARVPFLDYRLVEFTVGMPEESKLFEGVTKRVLRDAMQGILPEEVRTRMDKIGFATAEERWLRRDCPDGFRRALREAIDAARGILLSSAAEHLESVIGGGRAFSHLPWRMISFGAWMRRFDVQLA